VGGSVETYAYATTEERATEICQSGNNHDRLVGALKVVWEEVKGEIPSSYVRTSTLLMIKQLLSEIEAGK
jgi:hypothetical protein